MEIKGDEFLKNVKVQQEKNELEDRLEELNSNGGNVPPSNNPYEQSNPYASNNNISYEEEVSKSESELDDILLGANTQEQNKDNKKKYIVLGLILAILFLIVIIIFRLLSNESTEDNNLNNNNQISQEKALDNNSIEQQYQKIVNEKLKSIEDMKEKTEAEEKQISDSLDLNKIQKEEQKIAQPTVSKEDIQKTQELKKDIFEVEKKQEKVVEKVETPTVKKVTPKQTVQKQTVKASTKAPSGSFIQVGAFTKAIDKNYLENLNKSGLSYELYKVNIKGTDYTKVLIGPYNNRTEAKNNMNSVKKKLNVNSAFILSL